MMNGQNVVTSVNSDSADLARRLNTEAAKSMKYGGLSPEDALKLVTINPAKQLHIEAKVGSLENGKDADFVIWSGNPLSNYAHVQQTWIDGRKYFDRVEDVEARKSFAAQRERSSKRR
jgi:Imidazolonepropionase and related amidohydrolases